MAGSPGPCVCHASSSDADGSCWKSRLKPVRTLEMVKDSICPGFTVWQLCQPLEASVSTQKTVTARNRRTVNGIPDCGAQALGEELYKLLLYHTGKRNHECNYRFISAYACTRAGLCHIWMHSCCCFYWNHQVPDSALGYNSLASCGNPETPG